MVPITRTYVTKAHHQLKNSCQWCCRLDMNDGFGLSRRRLAAALTRRTMGQRLTGGKGKRPADIEFCNDPQHLFFFHYGEGIEIVFLEQSPSSRMVVCRVTVLTARVIYFSAVPSRKRYIARPSMWRQEQLSELLEKLAVAREVAGGIFPLHLAE